MTLSRKISKTLKLVLVFMIACFICIGNFSSKDVVSAASAKNNAPKVAELTIFSFSHYDIHMRHAFISIKNINKRPLDIFYAPVPAGYSKTIGTRGVDNTDFEKYGSGIYTNVEAFKLQKHNAYSGRVSLSTKITAKQLDTINKWMRDNNKHTYWHNCTWFSSKVWNLVCPDDLKLGCGAPPNPNVLSKNIMKKSGYKTNASIGKCDMNNITRFINSKKSIKIPPENIRSAIYSHIW